MMDVIALSELSDEPVVGDLHASPMRWDDFSPRLRAVLKRLPDNDVRIANALTNASILTLAKLQATTRDQLLRVKEIGLKSIEYIDAALAKFGIARHEMTPPIVVRDGAGAIEAHAQRLMQWAAERLTLCERENDRRVGESGRAMRLTEADVLADVMLILDGREPTNRRRWSS